MASGDFLELAERAARAARFDPTDSTDLARAKEAVNQSYLVACTRDGVPFDFLEREGQWATVAGTDTYAYSAIASAAGVTGATITEITSLTLDTQGYGGPLQALDWEGLETLAASSQDGDASSYPAYWAKWGAGDTARIRLYPMPDEAFTVGCLMRLEPAEMSANGDTPLIPLPFRHQVIVSHAAANLLRQEGGGEAGNEAQLLERQYESAWLSMRTAHAGFRRPTGRLMAPGWGDPRPPLTRGDAYGWTR